jgi:CPA2 family monovalent cation:H+ antiporter-2
MHGHDIFTPLLTLFMVTFGAAALMKLLRVPMLLGFLAAGVLAGPSGLDILHGEGLSSLAELGVVLLLFTIGLELSIENLWKLRREALIGGGLQLLLTSAFGVGAGLAFGLDTGTSVVVGFFLALSSTAVVLRLLADRGESDTPHGRISLAILLLQDVAVVPMVLAVPLLAGGGSSLDILWTLLRAVLVVSIVVFAARRGVPLLLDRVSILRTREGFLLGIAAIVFFTTWVTMKAGLSPALGAFLAGIVISETEHRHIALAETTPFRDLFLAIFFVTVGMLLDLQVILANPLPLLLLAVAVYLVKAGVIGGVVRVLGYPGSVAIRTGAALGQVGEFSFVILLAAASAGIADDALIQTLLATAAITLLLSPFMPDLANRFVQRPSSGRAGEPLTESDTDPGRPPHVIIVGFGHGGRTVARALKALGIPYRIAEMNPNTVREQAKRGEPIIRGDASKPEILEALEIHHACAAVVAINDPKALRAVLQRLKREQDDLHVIVRTRWASELDELYSLGASRVIPEELETSLKVAGDLLRHLGVSGPVIGRHLDELRAEGYAMAPHPVPMGDQAAPLPEGASMLTTTIEARDRAVGKSLIDLHLRGETGATVQTVTREGKSLLDPAHTPLLEGDQLVLTGGREALDAACERLRYAPSESEE